MVSRLANPAILGWSGVGIALAISIVLVAVRAHGDMSILGDEWHYAYWMSTDGALERGFQPEDGRYAIPIPFLVYEALFNAYGVESYVPFRVAMCVFLALTTGLAYELMRRRLGYGLALPLAALIPLFGTAGEVVVNSFRMPGMIALAASLGAMLLLERRSLLRDFLAAVLLLVAVASHPLGLAFVVAALIICLPSLRRLPRAIGTVMLVGVPLASFLLFLKPNERVSEPFGERLAEVPEFAVEGLRGVLAALLGFAGDDFIPLDDLAGFGSVAGLIALVALAFGLAWAVWKRRLGAAPLLAFLVAALIILSAPVFAPGERPANLGRYVFPAGVAMLIVIAELGRSLQAFLASRDAGPGALAATLAVFAALAIGANTVQLDAQAREYASDSRHVRAQAAALERVRPKDPRPERKIERNNEDLLGEKFRFSIEVAEYYVVSDDYGTPAWTPKELSRQNDEVQRTARLSRQIALGKRE